jgi:glycerol-3-phosphate dehydrogenase (NAD(P)+)
MTARASKRPSSIDVVVVGGGTFGTALASILSEMKRRVVLWTRRAEQVEEINSEHTNRRYLPDTELPPNLRATDDLEGCVRGTPLILMVVPSKSFRQVARRIGDTLKGDQVLVHATKGIEIESFKRMSEILREETCALKIGALSGPNLAREIMAGHPSGALVASRYDEVAATIQPFFAGSRMRIYSGHDVIGTEIAGAFKNIIAIAAGVADGMGMGDNAKSLLVTRGLSEMARFGVTLGADVFTFGGLAGIGDLMATCASPLSRNHQVGEHLSKGEKLKTILENMTQVAEGVPTTQAVHDQARQLGLDLPIVRAVHGMLYEDWSSNEAVTRLMSIPVERELAALRYR